MQKMEKCRKNQHKISILLYWTKKVIEISQATTVVQCENSIFRDFDQNSRIFFTNHKSCIFIKISQYK